MRVVILRLVFLKQKVRDELLELFVVFQSKQHFCISVYMRKCDESSIFSKKKKIVFDDVVFGAHEQIISMYSPSS